ncbi:uncharacterized protein LOC126613757 [Malus sylvestris]|uniref:uncharacterized protein LOC126613757 n=1 Tax=Malus sylvestris TaxID=3752 RepID=UPI0021AD4C23|nr:uncharacterized protein LOC126613757 [Malus sylvestris]
MVVATRSKNQVLISYDPEPERSARKLAREKYLAQDSNLGDTFLKDLFRDPESSTSIFQPLAPVAHMALALPRSTFKKFIGSESQCSAKINNELFFLAASEDVVEWRHLDQRRESKFNPIIGEFSVKIPEVSVKIVVVAMEAESEVCICEAMNCYKGIWEKVVEAKRIQMVLNQVKSPSRHPQHV